MSIKILDTLYVCIILIQFGSVFLRRSRIQIVTLSRTLLIVAWILGQCKKMLVSENHYILGLGRAIAIVVRKVADELALNAYSEQIALRSAHHC